MKSFLKILFLSFVCLPTIAQNYDFNFANAGRRVCLLQSEVNLNTPSVTIQFLDAAMNTNESLTIKRRLINGGASWVMLATNIPAGTATWVDNTVSLGQTYEYQVRRTNTWSYGGGMYDAIGYTIGVLSADNTGYKGRMILLVANNITTNLAAKYGTLKKELTADGWYVEEIIVAKALAWDSGNDVVGIKTQIQNIYSAAPNNDKPKALFILGHVPLPRSGSTAVTAPDGHDENKGARGCDAYYADIDGVYTDTATYNPGGLSTPLGVNLPADFKWDQDFFPSDIEMAFGRVDFEEVNNNASDLPLIENYLDRLSNYKNVNIGANMGIKSAFYLGYENSYDGSYRNLPNISKSANVYQNYASVNHPQWVQTNGPFKIYMQNRFVPESAEWDVHGMDATVFSSDQSYWGFGDVPQGPVYSRIRSLLATNTKCLVALWTTTGVNTFYQACTGQPLGLAIKEVMNHNQTNQYLERVPQGYDTPDWYNRTHFAYWGDPTITLYQVEPAAAPSIIFDNGAATINWVASMDANLVGYNVYESSTELGIYSKINTAIVSAGTSYILSNYTFSKWYMVKAISMQESGCGKFLQASIGKTVLATLPLVIDNVVIENQIVSNNQTVIFPNPASSYINIKNGLLYNNYELKNAQGTLVSAGKIKNNQISVGDFAAGNYTLVLNDGAKKVSFPISIIHQ